MAVATATLILGGIALAGTGFSFIQQQKAAKAEKKARRTQQVQQNVAARRERVQTLRQAQIAAASTLNAAAGMGAIESSGPAGGVSSVTSQASSNTGFSTQMSGLSRQISMFQQKAADARGLAGIGQSIAGLAVNAYGAGFGKPSTPEPAPTPVPSRRGSLAYWPGV